MHLVIHLQFISEQVDAGKQAVFLKGVIAEQVLSGLYQSWDSCALLSVAAKKEEYLGLESIALPV